MIFDFWLGFLFGGMAVVAIITVWQILRDYFNFYIEDKVQDEIDYLKKGGKK